MIDFKESKHKHQKEVWPVEMFEKPPRPFSKERQWMSAL
jgi:hypothetical protein